MIEENSNLNKSHEQLSDNEFQLSQISNMTEGTKFILKKAMDECPPGEDDNFFNSINSENQNNK